MRKAFVRLMLAAAVACATAGSGWATIIPVEEAVEAVALEVNLRQDLTGTVSGRSCSSCERKSFPITVETQAFENNVRVDVRRLRSRVGQPATIVYDIRSGEATRIIWYKN